MRIIINLLQVLAIVVLVLAIWLLVMDPRLRSLVVEDLSLLNPWPKSSEGAAGGPPTAQGTSQSGKAKQGSPTVTASGYTIAPGCALWPVEGVNLYYSPAEPANICTQAPGSPIQAG